MKKAELLSLAVLKATPFMIKTAREDVPKPVDDAVYRLGRTKEWRKYDLFLRAALCGEILHIAMYLPSVMRLGSRLPAYDIYMDKKAEKWLTYDREKQRWLTGKLDRLDWPVDYSSFRVRWLSKKDTKLIKEYLKVDKDGYDGILSYQREIRDKELIARHRKETDPWDADLAQTPELPKDWARWVGKVGVPEHFIFYDYVKKGATEGYCSYCEKTVPIRAPRHNKSGVCPCCRHKITFKSRGKVGTLDTARHNAYLLQQCADGMMIRYFVASRHYVKGDYEHPRQSAWEYRRVICSSGGKLLRAYYWGVYRQTFTRWIKSTPMYDRSYYCDYSGHLYGKTLPGLNRRGLCRTGLIEYWKRRRVIDPELYLARLASTPQLEMLSKANLYRLTDECMRSNHELLQKLRLSSSTRLKDILGINTQEMKRLRQNDGGTAFLRWVQYEKACGKAIPDSDITWLCEHSIDRSDIQFIANRMSVPQICNYIRRNMRRENMKAKEVITTWADYLSMAARFGMDTSDAIVYRVAMLRRRHDELVGRSINKDIAIQAGNVLLKFPHVEQICQSLSEKYNYEAENYVIKAPVNIEEIIHEGNKLHHCISGSERYWERIENHESYLLFLRKAAAPDVPYYTMEIEPGGTVRQIRTKYDRQEKDIDDARAFLREWQTVVSKRMTEDDRQKATQSRGLRVLEFAQMKKDQIKINTGHLAGRLLVEVLTADLMENMAA